MKSEFGKLPSVNSMQEVCDSYIRIVRCYPACACAENATIKTIVSWQEAFKTSFPTSWCAIEACGVKAAAAAKMRNVELMVMLVGTTLALALSR